LDTPSFNKMGLSPLLYGLIALIVMFILLFIFYPLYHILKLKYLYGETAIVKFYPIVGFIYFYMVSFKKHRDAMTIFRELAIQFPHAKMILTNI